jgi:hypothetical protein
VVMTVAAATEDETTFCATGDRCTRIPVAVTASDIDVSP